MSERNMRPAPRMNDGPGFGSWLLLAFQVVMILGVLVNVVLVELGDEFDPACAYRSLLFLGLLIFSQLTKEV